MKITVGIPAYNEAQNIGTLLEKIVTQEFENDFSLIQVAVFSDGSTDSTPTIVSQWREQDSRVELFKSLQRLGKPSAINEILRMARGDVIVLIDADTMPIGKKFLFEITRQLRCNPEVGIVAAVCIPTPPNTSVGRAAVFSSNVRRRLIWEKPYFAFNVAISISASIAKNLRLPSWIIGDDAYLYFKTRCQGSKTTVSRNAKILYSEPETLHDFILQRERYDANVAQLCKIFGDWVRKETDIPRGFWMAFFKEIARDPIGGFLWILLRGFLKLAGLIKNHSAANGFAMSTKRTFSHSQLTGTKESNRVHVRN